MKNNNEINDNYATDSTKLDFSDRKNIQSNNKEKIALALGITSQDRISRLNFINPEHLATVFNIKQNSAKIMNRTSLSEKIQSFGDQRNSIIQEGITQGIIQYLGNRKEYTKKDAMSHLGGLRDAYAHKLQLAGCNSEDFIIANKSNTNKADLIQYIKPNVNAECRITITKAILEHRNIKAQSNTWIKERFMDNYENEIIPILTQGSSLKEMSDGEQLHTSRIVELNDHDGSKICWMLIQHSIKKSTIKNHIYNEDNVHITCHKNTDSLIQNISDQTESLNNQLVRFQNMLDILPSSIDQLKECYLGSNKGLKNEILDTINNYTGNTKADAAIQTKVPNIGRKHARQDWLIIRSIRTSLQEEIEKVRIILEKNNLHCRSLKNQ